MFPDAFNLLTKMYSLLMERRREHGECDTQPNGRGCLVFGTNICTYRKPVRSRIQGILLWWLCLTLLGAGLAWGWMETQRRTGVLTAAVNDISEQVSPFSSSGPK
jgi:hypothetical protein